MSLYFLESSCPYLSIEYWPISVSGLGAEKWSGGGIHPPPWQKILFFNMKTGFKDPETPWLSQFYTNESNGTKFSTCFYIRMGLRDFFVRTSLGENGYFIGFWEFHPYFKLILHTSKRILCHFKDFYLSQKYLAFWWTAQLEVCIKINMSIT